MQDHALNLSISLRAGQESNYDSISNGEWTWNSSSMNRRWRETEAVELYDQDRMENQKGAWKVAWNGTPWRVTAPFLRFSEVILYVDPRVGLFGITVLIGRYISPKAKYWHETDSEQVVWTKDEKNSEKRVKQYVQLLSSKE